MLAVRDLFPALACADYTSPVPAERTLWVCDESTLQQATHLLLHDSVDCVGIDIESQADFDTRKPSTQLVRRIRPLCLLFTAVVDNVVIAVLFVLVFVVCLLGSG